MLLGIEKRDFPEHLVLLAAYAALMEVLLKSGQLLIGCLPGNFQVHVFGYQVEALAARDLLVLCLKDSLHVLSEI